MRVIAITLYDADCVAETGVLVVKMEEEDDLKKDTNALAKMLKAMFRVCCLLLQQHSSNSIELFHSSVER